MTGYTKSGYNDYEFLLLQRLYNVIDYSLSTGKQKVSYYNIILVFIILFIGLFSIGILSYTFYEAVVLEEKLVNNVKIPMWERWFWNYYNSDTVTSSSTMKPVYETLIVCYYTIEDKINNIQLMPKYVDPHLCTHIIVGYASVVNFTLNLGNNLTIYKKIVELKKIHPRLKIMISVSNDINYGFDKMVLNHRNRKIFIQSVLNITKTLNLNGLDLDWEFPAWAVKPGREKIHFAQLIYELKKEFNRSGQNLLLSAAVAAPSAIIDECYEVPTMAQYIDFINLMSYDYHFYIWYYPITDLNSPLYSHSMKTGYLSTLNVNFSANYWLLKGMPREKIVVGIPLYGHNYRLYNSLNHKINAPASGYGNLGYLGFTSYPQICDFLQKGAVRVFVNDSYVPYAYKDREWISYDDISSISYKAKWIKSNGFKGAMVYSLNMDDWNSTCTPNHTFPLTNTIKDIFFPKKK